MKQEKLHPIAVYNAIASGGLSDPGDRLLAAGGDPNVLRPWLGNDGRTYVAQLESNGKLSKPIFLPNAHATLRKDDWKILDDSIVKAAQERLRLIAVLRGAGLTFNIPQGMGKTVLETETQSNIKDAIISMDGLRESEDDRPEFELGYLPLPITHKDFQFSARQILVSRNGGSPLDTTTAELSGRKVAESLEKLALGRNSTYTFGGGTIYGMINYPSRMTRTNTAPTAAGWLGTTLLADLLAMRQQCTNAFHYGPYAVFTAPAWDVYLDADFKAASDKSLRQRCEAITGVSSISTLDFLQNYDIVMVQLTSDVIRLVIGMDMTTLQWDTKGGLQKNFKVMSIVVPQLRADFNSTTGIVHGTV